MNADASPGVAAEVRFEARVLPLAIVLAAIASALALVGGILIRQA
jgi:hypothetical protein